VCRGFKSLLRYQKINSNIRHLSAFSFKAGRPIWHAAKGSKNQAFPTTTTSDRQRHAAWMQHERSLDAKRIGDTGDVFDSEVHSVQFTQ
jgi:hypothetical protein